jgi:hypothetical protein
MTEHEEMVAVLEWADKHVSSCMGPKDTGCFWCVSTSTQHSYLYMALTLYQALLKAWKEEVKSE